MPKFLLLILLCVTALYAERDTVYVELITRDTVYIPIKPKTDTIYVVGDSAPAPTCCKPTEDNPFGLDTTKFLRNDTNYIHHSLYIGADIISALNSLLGNITIAADAELAFSRKNSLMMNFQYVKKVPSEDYTENFKKDDYSGNISQFIFGLGYRHYFRPAKTSSMIELGLNALFRHSDYTYHPRWKHDMVPTVVDRNSQGIQPYIHHGFVRRSDYVTCGFEYGIAYNVLSEEGDVLKKHAMYLTDGFQIDLKINISVGLL